MVFFILEYLKRTHLVCGWIISSQLDKFRLEVEYWIPAGKVSAEVDIMLSCCHVGLWRAQMHRAVAWSGTLFFWGWKERWDTLYIWENSPKIGNFCPSLCPYCGLFNIQPHFTIWKNFWPNWKPESWALVSAIHDMIWLASRCLKHMVIFIKAKNVKNQKYHFIRLLTSRLVPPIK